MELLFYAIATFGILLLGVGLYNVLPAFKEKPAYSFSLQDFEKSLTLPTAGKYTVAIKGGGKIKSSGAFAITVTPQHAERAVPVTKPLFRSSVSMPFTRYVIYCSFTIPTPGNYLFKVYGSNDLKVLYNTTTEYNMHIGVDKSRLSLELWPSGYLLRKAAPLLFILLGAIFITMGLQGLGIITP